MHSLKTIHDARRTRSIPQSRLQHHGAYLNLRSPSGSPVLGGGGTNRFPPGANGAHIRTTGRQGRQLAPAHWTAGREQPKQDRGMAKEEGKAGSSPGEAVLPFATPHDARTVEGGQDAEGFAAKDCGDTGNKEENRRSLLRTDSTDYELVRHVGAIAALEETPTDLAASRFDEDDWELLALDEEDAVKLGYRQTLDREKSWGSVVIAPVGA